MKRVCLVFALLLMFAFVVTAADDFEAVGDSGYDCLSEKVTGNCDSLSTEEKIFSALALGTCRSELRADADDDDCWPNGDCSVATTAQAILALNTNTDDAQEWIMDHTVDFVDINWFLEVDSDAETLCTASYDDEEYLFTVNADRTLDGNAGACLTVYNDYWFEIDSDCYNMDIRISCEDSSFLTTLLYQRLNSDTLYVSGKTSSASGGGSTIEKVNSFCFGEDDVCDYEGSLWASLVMNAEGYDITNYLPYLISMADDNEEFLPESFLFSLTNQYRAELLLKQVEGRWTESGDEYYDTALAMLPFQNTELDEKEDAKAWLEEVQEDDGCWNQGNIRNTAFILYSLWPQAYSGSTSVTDDTDCEAADYFCLSSASCLDAGGNVLETYSDSCFGTNVCCDRDVDYGSCDEQNGEICDSDQSCIGGTFSPAADTDYCCLEGVCGTETLSECEENNGYCRTSCSSNQKQSSYECNSGVCCVEKSSSGLWIVIVLIVLIALVVLGIVFRKDLKKMVMTLKSKIESKFAKGKKPSKNTRLPSTSSSRISPMGSQRKILPSSTKQVPKNAPLKKPLKNQKEFDDVLKKLRDIGK